jgi:hypothetical protein
MAPRLGAEVSPPSAPAAPPPKKPKRSYRDGLRAAEAETRRKLAEQRVIQARAANEVWPDDDPDIETMKRMLKGDRR